MAVTEEIQKSSWADEVEESGGELPPYSEVFDNDQKIITEYKYDEDEKKVKIVRQYRIERRVVSKSIALRKTWPKYGAAKNDKPGPNPATTIIGEDVFMQFISSREEPEKVEEDVLDKLRNLQEKTVKCRNCNGDHWTLRCPFKDTNYKMLEDKSKNPNSSTSPPPPSQEDKNKPAKYLPPVMRDGAKRSEPMRRGEDTMYPIRIANLSESTQDQDLDDLVKQFGPYGKIFLAKERSTGLCKGFAYVHFKHKADATKAIQTLNGYGYDHLILNVDWSKPATQN